jgi:hypothetical protein
MLIIFDTDKMTQIGTQAVHESTRLSCRCVMAGRACDRQTDGYGPGAVDVERALGYSNSLRSSYRGR